MSKTGRGILRGPGPYFCLYSPECVEDVFYEVHIQETLVSVQPDGRGTIWFVIFTERPQHLTLVFDGA